MMLMAVSGKLDFGARELGWGQMHSLKVERKRMRVLSETVTAGELPRAKGGALHKLYIPGI